MNENLDLCKILKDCPKGTQLYCPFLGYVEFLAIKGSIIQVKYKYDMRIHTFFSNGTYTIDGECMLFPSKDQRDWSKFKRLRFDPKDFKPFDKVLVKGLGCNSKVWAPCFLEEFKKFSDGPGAVVLIGFISFIWQRCIPYNDETMHLVNTEKDCPEYYKWWEE